MNLVESLATYLHNQGLGVYRPTTPGGTIYLMSTPTAPDEVIAITPYPGPAGDAKLAYDYPAIQIRTRGNRADSRRAYDSAYAIYNALHSLMSIELPGGIWLVGCSANAAPASMGNDANGRPECVVNFTLHVYAPSANRE